MAMQIEEANQEGTYVSYCFSVEERKNTKLMEEHKNIKSTNLEMTGVLLKHLFCTTEVHLYLPWWDEENTTDKPTLYYELKGSTKFGKGYSFIPPYNPILVRKSTDNGVVAAIYKNCLFNRTGRDIPHLMDLFSEMTENPKEFFEGMGKRWGKCLCCKRTLTVDASLERAMGPVCYRRITEVCDLMAKKMRVSVSHHTNNSKIVPVIGFFNPVEQEKIDEVKSVCLEMKGYGLVPDVDAGFIIRGEDNGCLVHQNLEPLVAQQIRSMLEMKKMPLIFSIERKTATTIPTLLELGIQKVMKAHEYWVCPFESSIMLTRYFEVKGVQNTILKHNSDPNQKQKLAIVQDGDKIHIVGNTFQHREQLKKMGGFWNPEKKTWDFVIAKKGDVQEVVDFINGDI